MESIDSFFEAKYTSEYTSNLRRLDPGSLREFLSSFHKVLQNNYKKCVFPKKKNFIS